MSFSSDAEFLSLVNSHAKMLSWPSGSLKEVARMYLIKHYLHVECIWLSNSFDSRVEALDAGYSLTSASKCMWLVILIEASIGQLSYTLYLF